MTYLQHELELSKCQCCRVEALRAEADVAFFSSHVSHLGVVVPAMCSATRAGSLSGSPHVLTWFEELFLCFVEMFGWGCKCEYSINNTAQMGKKKQKQSWYVDFPLYPGIICLEEGLCNGCRQSEQHKWEITHSGVVNTIFALSSGCRKHYYLIFFLQPRGILTCLKFSNTMPIWWHCTAIMKLEFCACSYFFLFPRAASCSFSC